MKNDRKKLTALIISIIAVFAVFCAVIPVVSAEDTPHITLGRIIQNGDNITYENPDSAIHLSNPAKNKNGLTLWHKNESLQQSAPLPSRYDLRDYGLVTSPEKQYFGDCWSYTTMSVLETNAAIKGFGEQHFSKSHLCFFTYNPAHEGLVISDVFNYGGSAVSATGTLSNLEGIALRYDYPNKTNTSSANYTESDRYNKDSGFIIENSVILNGESEIKEWIMTNGAVYGSMYAPDSFSTSAKNQQYNAYMLYKEATTSNHAITIIGWDDTIPASVFTKIWGDTPTRNGAWIIKNTWFGNDNDFMYLSYDTYMPVTRGFTVQEDFVNSHYSHSERVPSNFFRLNYDSAGEIFTATDSEYLEQVGFMIDTEGSITRANVKIQIYKNLPSDYTDPSSGTLTATYETSYTRDGYYTYTLPEHIPLSSGEIFAVVVSMYDVNDCNFCHFVEYSTSSVTYTYGPRESYLKFDDSGDYFDLYNYFGYGNNFMHCYTSCRHITAVKIENNSEITYCTKCGREISRRVLCTTHTWVSTKIISSPTCTKAGSGTHKCSVCGLSENYSIPANGHTYVIDKAVKPTCTRTGLTEGEHCSVCNTIFISQAEIPQLGHDIIIDPKIEPTCSEPGLTQGSHCSRCGADLTERASLAPLGHNTVIDREIPATCENTGLTAGMHCQRCNEVFIQPEVIPATGHAFGSPVINKETNSNTIEYIRTCSFCGQKLISSYIKGTKTITLAELLSIIFNKIFSKFAR